MEAAKLKLVNIIKTNFTSLESLIQCFALACDPTDLNLQSMTVSSCTLMSEYWRQQDLANSGTECL